MERRGDLTPLFLLELHQSMSMISMDLTNGFTPYGYAIIPNLWIRKRTGNFPVLLVYMRLLFRSKYAVNRACELLEDIHDTRENAFVGSILIRGDSIIVIVG